jgi:hypothetical protein
MDLLASSNEYQFCRRSKDYALLLLIFRRSKDYALLPPPDLKDSLLKLNSLENGFMSKKSRLFTDEQKAEAVSIVLASDKSIG